MGRRRLAGDATAESGIEKSSPRQCISRLSPHQNTKGGGPWRRQAIFTTLWGCRATTLRRQSFGRAPSVTMSARRERQGRCAHCHAGWIHPAVNGKITRTFHAFPVGRRKLNKVPLEASWLSYGVTSFSLPSQTERINTLFSFPQFLLHHSFCERRLTEKKICRLDLNKLL